MMTLTTQRANIAIKLAKDILDHFLLHLFLVFAILLNVIITPTPSEVSHPFDQSSHREALVDMECFDLAHGFSTPSSLFIDLFGQPGVSLIMSEIFIFPLVAIKSTFFHQ